MTKGRFLNVELSPNPRVTFDRHVMFMFVACIAARDLSCADNVIIQGVPCSTKVHQIKLL